MVGVLKLPSSAVALCGAWPVLRQVTVSPTATVTEAGEKKRSPMVTDADADLRAFGAAVLDAPATGAGTLADASCGWVEVSAPEPVGGAAGAAGLFGLSAGGA